ncbi:right-handed parallel beta-helix repeat-containing protein [Solibacillus sp. CAU 1738]|uniref:right-handed parallel beta-helix repeat-containing protein n=1 Tax=Solibacillus sp. CAU 1738 TaxID=3140363 RepID=UPI00326114F3
MAIIKVSTSIFSTIKTINRAIEKANRGDEIALAAGKYKESLHIDKYVTIKGKEKESTIIKGLIIIPKNTTVQFIELTLQPTSPIYIEGNAIFHNCLFIGSEANIILSANNGQLTMDNCMVKLAKEVGIALMNNSVASIQNCMFEANGKSHFLLEHSKLQLANSDLSKSTHALWIKSKSTAETKNVKFQHHTGTQIIVQENGIFEDSNSIIEHGQGNGIYAINQSNITLEGTIIRHHDLPQIWIQESTLHANHCDVQYGKESGIMLRDYTEATLNHCFIAYHKIANIQATLSSRLNIEDTNIHHCKGVGVQLREQSIANFFNTTFADQTLAQLFVTEQSIASLKECTFNEGQHVGIFIDKNANCTLINSKVINHANSAISVIDSDFVAMSCDISNNDGNGILAVQQAKVTIDRTKFSDNAMPHIAAKTKSDITLNQSELVRGKGLYVLDYCSLYVTESAIYDGEGVQIEVADHTKLHLVDSQVYSGASNGIKALRNSEVHIKGSQIFEHRMPQVVINDSSLIFKDSELLNGNRNGFIIENHSEALIQDSFISKHLYPQVWIDLESNVEMKHTHLTEGSESDLYVQNKSSVHVDKCIIQNDKFPLNIQAIFQSKVDLHNSLIENRIGESYFFDINSSITHYLDEVDY